MTEEQKNLLHNVYDEINRIENWDNKATRPKITLLFRSFRNIIETRGR